MRTTRNLLLVVAVSFGLFVGVDPAFAAKKEPEPVPLNEQGTQAYKHYSQMLESLRASLKKKVPGLSTEKSSEFLKAYEAEKGKCTVRKNGKEEWKNNVYNNEKAAFESLEAAKPLLAELDSYLSSNTLDVQLVKCAVLATATPRGLAEYVQQGDAQKKFVEQLLADTQLMKEMLYAGGAKAGRYGKAMEIYNSIQAVSEKAKTGCLRRVALAIGLELAAPELCGYEKIDPVKRYFFYEKSYVAKELHDDFDKLTTWQYRHVVNDPYTEDDMTWMREMLWNYRPDMINAPKDYRSRYVGLMSSEFGHKPPEVDTNLNATVMQQYIDRGGRCGPKAFFGRCLGRSFGLPVWGGRQRSHTAMTYWTPKGWTQILGVSWKNGFWIVDTVDSMRACYFKLDAMARDYPEEYIKVCRAQWTGDVLSEEKVDGMFSGTGGLWNALALNKKRELVIAKHPMKEGGKRPWIEDTYSKDDPKWPEQMMSADIPDSARKKTLNSDGVITIPAVACSDPRTNTTKIVFMKSRDGGMQLHYRRWDEPESFMYEFMLPQAGRYMLTANVVTVNREQFFLLKVNDAADTIRVELPYTVGKWEYSEPVPVSLVKGKNVLTFTRSAPEDFVKEGWKRAGPEYGGISVKSFTLKPVVP